MLRKLLDDLTARLDRDTEDAHRHDIAQATAALLIEIARADNAPDDEREAVAVSEALRKTFPLDNDAIAALVSDAGGRVEEAVSLFEFTDVLNEKLSREDKVEVVANLWRVAFADGHLDHFEEHYVRRIADLMHVSHGDFVRTKHAVSSQD